MTDKKIVRIAKYKRCSTNQQELVLQEETINKHINRMKEDNLNIEYVISDYSDKGLSGKDIDRPSFIRLIEVVKKKEVDCVIMTRLDRLSRSLQDLLNTTSIFKNNNVNFIVVEQKIDTSTPQGRFMFQMLGAVAEFEREMIKERMQAGRKRAEEVGTKSGKPCHRPNVKIDEEGVVHRYNNGVSMNQIAIQCGVSITPIRRILRERGLLQKTS